MSINKNTPDGKTFGELEAEGLTKTFEDQKSIIPDSDRLGWMQAQGIDTTDEYFLDTLFSVMKKDFDSYESMENAAEEGTLTKVWDAHADAIRTARCFEAYKALIRALYLENKTK